MACFIATLIGMITSGASTRLLFMTWHSSLLNPMTYLRLFTHVLGHSDWQHFIGNASFILLLGPLLEEKHGARIIVELVLITALITGVVNYIFFPNVALCGASGVVFAMIMMASFTEFHEGEIPLTVILVALFYLGQQVYDGILVKDNISNMAHIAGGLVGAIAGYGFNVKPVKKNGYSSDYHWDGEKEYKKFWGPSGTEKSVGTTKKAKNIKVPWMVVLLVIILCGGAFGSRYVTGKWFGIIADPTVDKSSIVSVNLDNIPEYSGNDYIVLNNNQPGFTDEDFQNISGENYSSLDYLGRCGTAVAMLDRSMMPTEERGEIGQIKPSGWIQKKYEGIVDSQPPYLYNRCHLIAYALTGQNANEENLITGTRYFNVNAMLPFEEKVMRYLDYSDNHVLYRVTPYFKGSELVARGVEMEAYSVEDQGDGLCFHVFVYNQQPGIEIDYQTGDSTVKE